jgi:proline iminopeptidase
MEMKGDCSPTRTDLYPDLAPNISGWLPTGDGHEIYWEECGNPRGTPVVFLHGGPGAGASAAHRRFFDPRAFRIVIFDQRGAGRSRPLAGLNNNTTPQLIADMELLRNRLKIDSWAVFGGSWGSTLALAYALVVRGVFLCRESEIDWFLYGLRAIFPEAWRQFAGFIPEAERDNLLLAYRKRLDDPDPRIHLPAARRWSAYEGACSTLLPNPAATGHFAEDRVALGLARIEAHYFANGGFLPAGGLLAGIDRIRHIPCTIVQGRYDMVCPMESADALHRAWPEAEYIVVPDAGHSAWEPGICAQLVAAMERLKLPRATEAARSRSSAQ